MTSKQEVLDKLKLVQDPEINVNIVDLGLVYSIWIENEKIVHVKMTLTTPACPLLGELMDDIKTRLKELKFEEVDIVLVWDPPWNPEMMTDEAKAATGMI